MAYSSLRVFKEPLCLIDTDHYGKLYVKSEVMNQLKSIEQNLNIVTITGLYRTGKSYLMNRLAGVSKGFPLGATIQSETKGIWVWCRPHPVHKDQVLVLMDTEGLGDVKKGDKNHDNWLFALAVLLSSTVVYNVVGIFNEENLEKMSFVTEISNHIKTSEMRRRKDDSEFDLFFPILVVALRDFSLEMKKDGRDITEDEYLEEECLKPQEAKSEKELKYNEPRLCIRKYFKTRKCFTFDRPANRKKLAKLEQLTDSDLSSDFVEDSIKFVKYIYRNCPPKKLDNGHTVNGRMFAALVKNYVDAIRNGAIPCVESALNTMAELENTKAVESGIEVYTRSMRSMLRLPARDNQILSDTHQYCIKKAIAHFLEKSIYDREEKYLQALNSKILETFEKIQIENEKASIEKCRTAIEDLYNTIHAKMVEKKYFCAGGFDEYIKDLNALQAKYGKMAGLGCKKDEMLLTFLESKHSEGQAIQQADKMITVKERETEAERQKAILAAMEKENIENQVRICKQEYEDLKRQMIENIEQLEEKRKDELEQIQRHYEKIITKRIQEKKRLLEERHMANVAELNTEILSLKRKLQEEEQERINQSNEMSKNLQDVHKEYLKERRKLELKIHEDRHKENELELMKEYIKQNQNKEAELQLQIKDLTELVTEQHLNASMKKKVKTGCILS